MRRFIQQGVTWSSMRPKRAQVLFLSTQIIPPHHHQTSRQYHQQHQHQKHHQQQQQQRHQCDDSNHAFSVSLVALLAGLCGVVMSRGLQTHHLCAESESRNSARHSFSLAAAAAAAAAEDSTGAGGDAHRPLSRTFIADAAAVIAPT